MSENAETLYDEQRRAFKPAEGRTRQQALCGACIYYFQERHCRTRFRTYLLGKKYEGEKKEAHRAARKRQIAGLRQGNNPPVRLNSDEREKSDSLVKAAKKVGSSKDSVWKVEHIQTDAVPEVFQAAKEGKISILKAFEISKLPEPEKLPQNDGVKSTETAVKIAKETGTSKATVERAAQYAKAVDRIAETNGGSPLHEPRSITLMPEVEIKRLSEAPGGIPGGEIIRPICRSSDELAGGVTLLSNMSHAGTRLSLMMARVPFILTWR